MRIKFSQGFAEEKPRLGVLRFTNHTSAGWWEGSVGTDLQDMLIAELASTNSFRVLERRELDAVLNEQDLGDSGRVNPRTRARLGKITVPSIWSLLHFQPLNRTQAVAEGDSLLVVSVWEAGRTRPIWLSTLK